MQLVAFVDMIESVSQYLSEPFNLADAKTFHYGAVIMGTLASQITSLTIVYSTIYSDADHRKLQSSASLAFVQVIHRWIPRTNGQ